MLILLAWKELYWSQSFCGLIKLFKKLSWCQFGRKILNNVKILGNLIKGKLKPSMLRNHKPLLAVKQIKNPRFNLRFKTTTPKTKPLSFPALLVVILHVLKISKTRKMFPQPLTPCSNGEENWKERKRI